MCSTLERQRCLVVTTIPSSRRNTVRLPAVMRWCGCNTVQPPAVIRCSGSNAVQVAAMLCSGSNTVLPPAVIRCSATMLCRCGNYIVKRQRCRVAVANNTVNRQYYGDVRLSMLCRELQYISGCGSVGCM